MTDKTRVIAARVPNEVADWVESYGSARAGLEAAYELNGVDLRGFKRACDRLRIDYQLAVNQMTEEINAIPKPKRGNP